MAKLVAILIIIIASTTLIQAQDFSKDVEEQVPIILKALNHNNTIKDKIKDNCIIAVLYNPQSAVSEEEKKAIVEVLNDNKKIKVHKKKIEIMEIPMSQDVNLEKKIIIKKINAFWLTSGTENYMNMIRESARFNQVITIASKEDLVTGSMAAMGAQKTETGHKLLLNLNEMNSMNINFQDNLLSEAIVIK